VPIAIYYNALIYFLLPFTLFIYGVNQPILVYLNRIENYKAINIFRIIQVLSTCFFTILLAIMKIKYALIIGFFIGLLIATFYIMQFITIQININLLIEKLKKFDQFPKYGTLSSLFNNISRNSITLLLAQFFSQQMVGFYSYSTRLLNAPTGMYNSALSQIYFKMASNADTRTLKKETHKIIRFTFLIGLIPTLVLLVFGKQLFYLLFSGEWLTAGTITQYLILWYFTGVIVGPISFLLDVKNKLKFEFNYNMTMLLLRITAIVIGGFLHNFYISILLFSIVGIFMNLFLLFYIDKHLLKVD
jgi:O-antigen/teichoic acid export membrane protein